MLQMQQIQQGFVKRTYIMLHPKWVQPYRSNYPFLVTIEVKDLILLVPAYIPICPRRPCSQHLHAHKILQPLLRLQESKAMRVRAQNEHEPRPLLLYTLHNSTAYVQELQHPFTGSLPKPLKGIDF